MFVSNQRLSDTHLTLWQSLAGVCNGYNNNHFTGLQQQQAASAMYCLMQIVLIIGQEFDKLVSRFVAI